MSHLDENNPASERFPLTAGCAIPCVLGFLLFGFLWPLGHALGGTLDENTIIFPILIGGPCFLIGNILAVIGLSSPGSGTRPAIVTLVLLWGSVLAFFLVLLVVPDPSVKGVAGVYEGSYQGASETLYLNEDGTFEQRVVLPSGEPLFSRSKWQLNHRVVDLDNCYDLIDEAKGGQPSSRASLATCRYLYSAGMLVNDWGSGYYTLKRRVSGR